MVIDCIYDVAAFQSATPFRRFIQSYKFHRIVFVSDAQKKWELKITSVHHLYQRSPEKLRTHSSLWVPSLKILASSAYSRKKNLCTSLQPLLVESVINRKWAVICMNYVLISRIFLLMPLPGHESACRLSRQIHPPNFRVQEMYWLFTHALSGVFSLFRLRIVIFLDPKHLVSLLKQ